jgi:hypothetical protein
MSSRVSLEIPYLPSEVNGRHAPRSQSREPQCVHGAPGRATTRGAEHRAHWSGPTDARSARSRSALKDRGTVSALTP